MTPRGRRRSAYLAGICVLIGVGIRSTGAATAPDIQQRIDRICGHIPPPVIMEGERPGDTTLRALMEKLHVPGISVAVIHDGMIEWARGFGVRFAERLRSIVALNRHVFATLGPVQSIAFLHVSPTGMDTYHIIFRNGQGDMDLSLSAAGKVRYALYFAG